jgi:tRNA dimethylallyltransferase
MLDDLARGDPETWASIDRDNPMRVQRAWDVLTATGRGLVAWRQTRPEPLLRAQDTVRIVVAPAKTLLNETIERRFLDMIRRGALAECAAFLASGGDLAAPSGRALGAAELIAHLEGRLSLDEAAAAAVVATRRYAKRQRTWFRSRMKDWAAVDPATGDPLRAVPPDQSVM